MLKRSLEHPRLLRPHGNRASLQRHSNARVALVPAPPDTRESLPAPAAEPDAEAKSPVSTKKWRRRKNTY